MPAPLLPFDCFFLAADCMVAGDRKSEDLHVEVVGTRDDTAAK
jgi:hypothetical protein